MGQRFKDNIDDERILLNVLQKNLEIFDIHREGKSFTSEWKDLDLLTRISAYFFWCHSLLNLCLQNGHKLESAWWLPWQFKHLNEWGHGMSFLVFSLGGLILGLALQHQLNSLWCSDLCGPLHLMHLAPWILQENVVWPHFQQFLHWGTPGFMLALLMVAMKFPTLKHLLINILAFLLLWTSQISIQTMDMSDLGETLITLDFDAREMLSKMWFCLRIASMSFDMSLSLELRWGKKGMPVILR